MTSSQSSKYHFEIFPKSTVRISFRGYDVARSNDAIVPPVHSVSMASVVVFLRRNGLLCTLDNPRRTERTRSMLIVLFFLDDMIP